MYKKICKDREICSEPIECETIVYSATYMLEPMLKEIHREQLETFGVKGIHGKKYTYLNNYCLTVDTVFRLLLKIGQFYKNIIKRFNAKRLYLVYDVTRESVSKLNVTRYCIPKTEIVERAIRALRTLSMYISKDETENYDAWERLLVAESPAKYNFSLHHPKQYINNYYRHERYSKEFMLYASYLQIGLCDEMLYEIILYAFRMLRLNRVSGMHIITCDDCNLRKFMSLLARNRTIAFLNKHLYTPAIYYERNGKIYCNGCTPSRDPDPANITDAKCLLKHARKRLLDLYDCCESYNQGMILDMNSAYGLNIYENMHKVLLLRELYTIKQELIVADEDYAWLCKEVYIDKIPSWIECFNGISTIRIIER